MHELPHTHSCFVCGDANPHGFNLRPKTDGHAVQIDFAFRPEHVGFKRTVHGGLTATILDEIMTWACAVRTRKFAYCGELNVRYILPVKPEQPMRATAELVVDRRGRIFETKAELRDQAGTLFVTATGKYLPLKDAEAIGMASDFVGSLDWLDKPDAA